MAFPSLLVIINLLQHPQIGFKQQLDIIDSILQHGRPVYADAEGQSAVLDRKSVV